VLTLVNVAIYDLTGVVNLRETVATQEGPQLRQIFDWFKAKYPQYNTIKVLVDGKDFVPCGKPLENLVDFIIKDPGVFCLFSLLPILIFVIFFCINIVFKYLNFFLNNLFNEERKIMFLRLIYFYFRFSW
jgi:hypothetical protein